MSLIDDAIQSRQLKAPSEDGAIFVEPPANQIADLLAANLQRRWGDSTAGRGGGDPLADHDCQGRRLGDLMVASRRELLDAASQYTRSYRDVDANTAVVDKSTPLILAGHQPDLFHTGVWAKNFAIDRLAQAHRGVAINLLIDSDVPKTAYVKVPAGTVDRPRVDSLPLSRFDVPLPYEEWRVRDDDLLASFGRRATAAIAGLVSNPLVRDFWPLVEQRTRDRSRVGYCLAQARHQLEGQWGSHTLEVPQSAICSGESFYWFTAHLLAHLPRLHEIYNTSTAEYRRANRIRSRAHPVPDLTAADGWLEAPFWIWDAGDPRRRRLMVRPRGDELLLSDGAALQWVLTLSPEADADTAVSQLAAAAQRGIKIRTRALITTMFARLFLSDLFVHGIGGAKYDQLTDMLIRRFFQAEPPSYLAFSGTLKLPVPYESVSIDDLRMTNRQLRDLRFNPDRYLENESDPPAQAPWRALVDHKRHWVNTAQDADNARTRYHEIRRCNESLQPFVTNRSRQLRMQRDQFRQQLHDQAILASRQYAFCFLPESTLRDYLLDKLADSL